MLEDLDADEEIVARMWRQGAQATADEVMAAIRCMVNQVFDRDRGDIEPHEIETTTHQRQVVSAIATADVETAGNAGLSGGDENVFDERHR